jgi:hypothetical protein
MPAVVIAKPDDEIADLIDRVRASSDLDVGLVVPASSRALQTPLNVRLLAQFSNQSGRRTSIVTEDGRLQQLARASGLQVYGSVPAFERGIELSGPRLGGGALGSGALGRGTVAGAAGLGTAAAVLEPPPAPPPAPPPVSPPAHAPAAARLEPRRVMTQMPPARRTRGWDRRRLLYVAGAAVAVIGIVLFMTLAPSAKITITIDATPLSVSPTIQGSTSSTAATQPDHVLTGIVTSTAQNSFQATPTGTLNLPAVAATAKVVFSTDDPDGFQFSLPQGNEIELSGGGSPVFAVAGTTYICIGPNGNAPPSGVCNGSKANATASVADTQPGALTQPIAANTLTGWPSDPCPTPEPPNATDIPGFPYYACFGVSDHQYHAITVTNPSPSTLGTNASTTTSASATDVANWNAAITTLEGTLASQIQTDLTARAAGKTFAKDPTGGGQTISYAMTPAKLPAVNAPFTATTIQVIATAQAAIYDPVAVRNDVIADLDKLVKPGDELAPGKLSTPPCTVTQANVNGTVILACSATDYSQPQVNLDTLKAQLTGRNPGNAQKIVENNIQKVQTVQVSEWPFKLFYLPLRASQIAIDENVVAVATKSP